MQCRNIFTRLCDRLKIGINKTTHKPWGTQTITQSYFDFHEAEDNIRILENRSKQEQVSLQKRRNYWTYL